MTEEADDEGWGSFAATRRRKFTLGLQVPVERRLAWLEEALTLAARSGALERRRALRAREGRRAP